MTQSSRAFNESQTLRKAFSSASTAIPNLDGLAKTLNTWYLSWPEYNFLHPCVIGGQPALVCQADLSEEAPDAYQELQKIANHYGLFLKQDSRKHQIDTDWQNRRRNVGLVLTFCLGLMASSRVVCAAELYGDMSTVATAAHLVDPPAGGMQAISIKNGTNNTVISLRRAKPPAVMEVLAAYSQPHALQASDLSNQSMIQEFLRTAYKAEAGDPSFAVADFAEIAKYFASYPQAVDLINALHDQKITLQYRKDTWQTQAWGSQSSVDSVTIYFDTRLGAQLLDGPGCESNPACGISPADALLHELLHAKLMLLDSEHFIAEGGMSPSLYPFAHEREVIHEENQLYQGMNHHDGRYRPIRHQHSGNLTMVACPACAPSQQLVATSAQ